MTARRWAADALAVAALASLTIAWLWPLVAHGSSVLPGQGPGDNLTFVWNMWWTRYALTHEHSSLFFTPFLFHPFGADLTLHTSTLLPAVVVSIISDPVAAQNGAIVLNVWLNFVCAYALARHETRDWRAALLGGVLFGWSPYVLGHLAGHFNLIGAWVLPLAALAAVRSLERPSFRRSVALGIVLGASAYVDYYLFVYALVLVATLWVYSALTVTLTSVSEHSTARQVLTGAVLLLLVIDLAVLTWVLSTGGDEFTVLGRRISIRGSANPIAIAWLLGLVSVCLSFVARIRLNIRIGVLRSRMAAALTALGLLAVIISPLIWHAMHVWQSGEYATQRYFWRSAPPGIDLATVVLGNPFSVLYGKSSSAVYARFGIDAVESAGWMTPGMIVLAIAGARVSRAATGRGRWLLLLFVFGLWAVGPYVHVAGHATTMWMPAVLLRWVPIVNNARTPGRAIVIVYLGLAVLAACGFAALWRDRRRGLAGALATLALVDIGPARPALYSIERPRLYETLKGLPPGAVCELPVGLRDGFGEIGEFDERSMLFQTIHEHAMVGGFEARMPASLAARYEALPVLATLLHLSSGTPPPAVRLSRDEARRALAGLGVRYVVVNRATSPPGLLQYVAEVLPLDPLATEDDRTLFVVR